MISTISQSQYHNWNIDTDQLQRKTDYMDADFLNSPQTVTNTSSKVNTGPRNIPNEFYITFHVSVL